MISILDLLPETLPVRINDQDVEVTGVSVKGVVALFRRFPEIRTIMSGRGSELNGQDVIDKLPDSVPAIIAAGCGQIDNPAAEDIVSRLPLSEQVELLEAVLKLTFKDGIGPFAAKLAALGLLADRSTKARDTSSPRPSRNSGQAEATTTPGTTPPVN